MPDGSISRPRRGVSPDVKLQQQQELAEIRDGLRQSAGSLADQLLGKPGRRAGNDLRYGDTGVLRVTVAGRMAGRWHDYGSGAHGDMLELIQAQRGVKFTHALEHARQFLGMPQPDYSRPMSDQERKAAERRLKALAKQRAKEDAEAKQRLEDRNKQVARRATVLWEGYRSPAPVVHPYLTRKGVDGDGLAVNRRGVLLVPVRDKAGSLQTLQRLWPNGFKAGLLGGAMSGGRLVLGTVDPTKPVLFSEGLATGKSLHASTGMPVVVTFSADNMQKVMRAWRADNPDQVMICAGDNDHQKPLMDPPKANVGAELTERMRKEVGSVSALPPFEPTDPGTDYNDLEQARGRDFVRQHINNVISAAQAAKQEQTMPDGSQSNIPAAQAATSTVTAAPADARQVLREAVALDGVVSLGLSETAAATAAQAFVKGLSDDQVTSTLATGHGRGWVINADGSLDASATAERLKAAAAAPASPAAKAEAPEAAAAAPEAKSSGTPAPRRILMEAMAIEGVAKLGMSEKDAVGIARRSIRGMSDEQVASTLASAPDRGWIMRPDGTLDPSATAAAIKAATPGAPGADKPVTPHPLRDVIAQMHAGKASVAETNPGLVNTIESLTEKAGGIGALDQDRFRTRIAWAVLDYERATGTKIDMPEDLRREIEGRMTTYPGLTNPQARSLLSETATLASIALIRDIRRAVSDIVAGGDQDTPDVADRLERLSDRRPASEATRPPVPLPEAPAETAVSSPATATPAPAPEAQQSTPAEPPRSTASPGPGDQPAANPVFNGQAQAQAQAQAPAGSQGAAVLPGQAAAGGAKATEGVARQSLASHLLSRIKRPTPPTPAPWEKVTSGLSNRLASFEQGVSEQRASKILNATEAVAHTATREVAAFIGGAGRPLMSLIETAAARDPGGMPAVIAGMAVGGRHEGLRVEFDAQMQKNPRFATAYRNAVKAIGQYGDARLHQKAEFQRLGVPAGKDAALDTVDSKLGEDASRMPGLAAGKNALQELAIKVTELLKDGIAKIRNVVASASAAATASASPSPVP